MTAKTKSTDSTGKAKTTESIWKKAFAANSEWPDKVSSNHETTIEFNKKLK